MTTADLASAYGAAAGAWAAGPERTYAALATALVDRAPVLLAGRRVADVGAGTGVASRVLAARGALPYGVDVSLDMLRHDRANRPPAAVADALSLPFRDGVLGGVAYAFCLNHLADPVAALREAKRVLAPGGVVLGAVFAAGWDHPAKAEADAVLRAHGWRRPAWYDALKDDIEPLLSSPRRFAAAATAAGLVSATAVERIVETDVVAPRDLAAWRLGMAAVAPYVAALSPAERSVLVADVERAVTPAQLRPAVVLLTALRP